MQSDKPSILLICNTPFQIVMACHIARLYYTDYLTDIVISEGIRGGEQLAKNAIRTNVFRNVIFTKNKKTFLAGHSIVNKIQFLFGRIFEIFNNYRIARNISKNHYDVCLFSNISILTKILGSLLRKKNPAIRLTLYEEGLVTYTTLFASGDAPTSLYSRFIDKEGLLSKVDIVYVCHPRLLTWQPINGKVVQIPHIDKTNKAYVELLNKIFDYHSSSVDIYDKKVIFFEESHSFEGFDVPDIEIVNQIADTIGKENIMIKIHPRNPENRFAKLGYKTNTNISIPWELLLLNQEFTDKIFVTISSGAVVSPFLYMGMPCITYSLLNCLPNRPGYMQGALGDMMQHVYQQYSDIFKAPTSIEQFLSEL